MFAMEYVFSLRAIVFSRLTISMVVTPRFVTFPCSYCYGVVSPPCLRYPLFNRFHGCYPTFCDVSVWFSVRTCFSHRVSVLGRFTVSFGVSPRFVTFPCSYCYGVVSPPCLRYPLFNRFHRFSGTFCDVSVWFSVRTCFSHRASVLGRSTVSFGVSPQSGVNQHRGICGKLW